MAPETNPPITVGRAPSHPATAIMMGNFSISSTLSSKRQRPATPISCINSWRWPKKVRVLAASAATAASLVPAVIMAMFFDGRRG